MHPSPTKFKCEICKELSLNVQFWDIGFVCRECSDNLRFVEEFLDGTRFAPPITEEEEP